MRRLAFAASFVLFAAGVQAQPGVSVWELQSGGATITANKSKFAMTAGALEWNAAKPEQSTFALSLDTTTLGDEALKTELDAAHFPELRIITAGPGRVSGGKTSLPTTVTIGTILKPVTFEVSYKSDGPRQLSLHAEAALRASDFKLKGGDIALVIDAPFKPNSGQ
jgi:polyisoprenoid-binding protein YceI